MGGTEEKAQSVMRRWCQNRLQKVKGHNALTRDAQMFPKDDKGCAQ
jgi:hypothetical protein